MTRVGRLVVVLVINVVLMVAMVVVGLTAHSLGVLAAGGDSLADIGAVALSLLAIWLSRRPPTSRRPQGHPRATSYAALVNAGLLGVVVVVVSVEAILRLVHGTSEVHGLPVLLASLATATVMLLAAVIVGGDEEEDEDEAGDRANMRAVLLDTIADSATAASVAVTGAVFLVTGRFYWLDPAVALVVAAVIGYQVLILIRDVLPPLRPRPNTTQERVDLG